MHECECVQVQCAVLSVTVPYLGNALSPIMCHLWHALLSTDPQKFHIGDVNCANELLYLFLVMNQHPLQLGSCMKSTS